MKNEENRGRIVAHAVKKKPPTSYLVYNNIFSSSSYYIGAKKIILCDLFLLYFLFVFPLRNCFSWSVANVEVFTRFSQKSTQISSGNAKRGWLRRQREKKVELRRILYSHFYAGENCVSFFVFSLSILSDCKFNENSLKIISLLSFYNVLVLRENYVNNVKTSILVSLVRTSLGKIRNFRHANNFCETATYRMYVE